jgi:hypothetical protein
MAGEGREREELVWQLRQIVGEDNVLVDEPMSKHTTFEIGGPADVFVIPESTEEVRDVVAACREARVDYFILGNGSDLLVSDDGYRGVIIGLADGFTNVSIDGNEMTCQAGVSLREASEMACELGLSGLEFACGIPGTIGGACFMNAGAYDGCIADVLKSVRVICPDGSLETIGEYNTAFMMLEQGTYDAIAVDEPVANFNIAGKEDIFRILEEPLNSEHYGVGFAKGNEALAAEVEAAMQELAAEGLAEELCEKYGLSYDNWCLPEA